MVRYFIKEEVSMSMDNLTLSSLRDAIKSNTEMNRKLKNELHVANLLKMVELGLVDDRIILSDEIVLDYKKELNNKTYRKSL